MTVNFNSICQDLNQLGMQGHEWLTYRDIKPATCRKSHWIVRLVNWLRNGACFGRNIECEKAARIAFKFFQNNREHCTGHSETIAKLLTLKFKDNALRFNITELWKAVAREEVINCTRLECENLRKGAQQDASQIEKQTRLDANKITQNAINAKLQLESDSLTIKMKTERELEKLKGKIEKVQAQLRTLYEVDTLIVCGEKKQVVASLALLTEKIPYFATLTTSVMNRPTQPDFEMLINEKKADYSHLQRVIDLHEWSADAISCLVNLISQTTGTEKLDLGAAKDNSLILELYQLASFLHYDLLGNLSTKAIQTRSSRPEILELLSPNYIFPTNDPLIQWALGRVIDSFELFAEEGGFLNVQHEHLIKILRSDDLGVSSEKSALSCLQRWVKHKVQTDSMELLKLKINGEALVDHIRWEHLPDSSLRELDLLVQVPTEPRKKRPLMFSLKRNRKSREIVWRLPHLRAVLSSQIHGPSNGHTAPWPDKNYSLTFWYCNQSKGYKMIELLYPGKERFIMSSLNIGGHQINLTIHPFDSHFTDKTELQRRMITSIPHDELLKFCDLKKSHLEIKMQLRSS